ncbi:MAG: hypothetical protein H6644_08790 [Caldilineaceae bacterium]|nr:hypothetical protein [Caldilineaceae bacterium]
MTKAIYTADGVRYSDVISVTIDSATFDGTTLDVAFSAGQSQEIEGVDATTILPSIMVGLYGWDTKDFAIGPHERLFDDNGDGTIDGSDQRTLEYVVGRRAPAYHGGRGRRRLGSHGRSLHLDRHDCRRHGEACRDRDHARTVRCQ